MDYIFMSRPYWNEIGIANFKVVKKYKEYFGNETITLNNRKEAVDYLLGITSKIQRKMINYMKSNDINYLIRDLYKILDESYHFYYRQKAMRNELKKLNVQDGAIFDTVLENRNKSRNVIDSINLWVENCVLFQQNNYISNDKSFELNEDLFLEMYIYGLASQALSLISLSKKFEKDKLFTGIKIQPKDDAPIEIIKYHPIIYYNTAITGNQNCLAEDNELRCAEQSEFEKAFQNVYGISFTDSMKIISKLELDLLCNGRYALTIISKEKFISIINKYNNENVDGEKFFNTFVLTKENIQSQLEKKYPIIWKMNSNKYRHELRPFICLEDSKVYISYCAMEQAKNLWDSIYLNGGMCYSNEKDFLTEAVEQRNKELSDKLVDVIRDKLNKHYKSDFDKINVQYDKIFGKKDIDYGDYDLVFYTKETKELFLIEAKFFSDSLNNSGIITDHEKMFVEKGYYDHCRKRYDLAMEEKEKLKLFIGAQSEINVHFLFVSSKPLEIEFQDKDKIVTFLCLSIFDKYIEGKLLPEIGDKPIRPIHKL